MVSRVEVLEGGALLAQPNDWRILVDEPDGGMSPAHYLNAVHAVANQCRAEHLRCAAAVNTLDDLLESGEVRHSVSSVSQSVSQFGAISRSIRVETDTLQSVAKDPSHNSFSPKKASRCASRINFTAPAGDGDRRVHRLEDAQ